MLGQTLSGRYQIVSKIGQGEFCVTFIAQDLQRPGNPQFIVKQFQPLSTDPYTLEAGKILFDREAETLETLGHEQIPKLLAHIGENQQFYLVQEYIPGHDLSEELRPDTQLNQTAVIKLLKDILEVLAWQDSVDTFTNDVITNLPQVNIINTDAATLANRQVYQLVYSGKDNQIGLKTLKIWTLKNNQAYVITYTDLSEDYNQFLNIAKQMIRSFELE